MAKRCTPCMGAALKQLALENNPNLSGIIRDVPDCKDPLGVEFCLGRGVKGKRAPSAYNEFVSECIKRHGGIKSFADAGRMMKECAAEWRKKKASE